MNIQDSSPPALDATLLERLLDEAQREGDTRRYFLHNLITFKMIRGGLRMALAHERPFDPVSDYWYRPERRLTLAYMVNRWSHKQIPAEAVRRHALHVFQHMDRARELGLVTMLGTDYDAHGGWAASIMPALHDHARRLPSSPAYADIQRVQPKLPDADQHLDTFLAEASAHGDGLWSVPKTEPNFADRARWLPYLGATGLQDLLERQRFTFAFLHLMTSNNAYRVGGALGFAPLLQNTSWPDMLRAAARWVRGDSLVAAPFYATGNERGERAPRNRSHYSVVSEIYGFLQLERAPFINQLSRPHYQRVLDQAQVLPDATLSEQIGLRVRALLQADAALTSRLSAWFTAQLNDFVLNKAVFVMESVSDSKLIQRATEQERQLIDAQLLRELDGHASAACAALTAAQLASCAAHLLLDTMPTIARWSGDAPIMYRPSEPAQPPVEAPSAVSAAAAQPGRALHLPESLREPGERALAYLRAGLHVVLAGAPGTGKTTLAQFVAHAWNQGLRVLPMQLPLESAPMTTVGNSAWTPFHTIGGIVMDAGGGFRPAHGVFIDPAGVGSAWRLRNEALVLDEMNRADLDRCIGDLYPLLSGSVEQVYPAGIPGVRTIHAAPRFRLIATINDATLDDIVFPISQGLARRFQRIELEGASQAEILAFLEPDALDDRLSEAARALALFFERASSLARWTRWGHDRAQRLPFGVGWFELLRRWVTGQLELPERDAELPAGVLAAQMLRASLRGLTRDAELERLLDGLDDAP